MLPAMQSLAIRTEDVADGRWCRVTPGTAVADIGPQSACHGLALAWLQHRDGRVVAMKSMASEHMLADLHQQWLQQCAGLADPVRHGRAGKIDAFPRVNLGLAIERQVIAISGDQDMGDQTRLAAPDNDDSAKGRETVMASASAASISSSASSSCSMPRSIFPGGRAEPCPLENRKLRLQLVDQRVAGLKLSSLFSQLIGLRGDNGSQRIDVVRQVRIRPIIHSLMTSLMTEGVT